MTLRKRCWICEAEVFSYTGFLCWLFVAETSRTSKYGFRLMDNSQCASTYAPGFLSAYLASRGVEWGIHKTVLLEGRVVVDALHLKNLV